LAVIRAFVAVDIDSAVTARIAAAIELLKPRIPGIRWVAPQSIHLTLKFLGNIDESGIEAIGAALRSRLRLFRPFSISVKGLGVFPGPRRARVLWVGLPGARLQTLASGIESALQPLGFAPESRPFSPHLTIGRWRETSPAPALLSAELANWQAHDFGASDVGSVRLMQSLLRPDGAKYRALITVPLAGS
jgi:2'-5' RNA ligase